MLLAVPLADCCVLAAAGFVCLQHLPHERGLTVSLASLTAAWQFASKQSARHCCAPLIDSNASPRAAISRVNKWERWNMRPSSKTGSTVNLNRRNRYVKLRLTPRRRQETPILPNPTSGEQRRWNQFPGIERPRGTERRNGSTKILTMPKAQLSQIIPGRQLSRDVRRRLHRFLQDHVNRFLSKSILAASAPQREASPPGSNSLAGRGSNALQQFRR